MLPSADAQFNYAALPAEKAASARAAAERIRGRMQLAAESIIEVGRELSEQQTSMGRGNFLNWIEAEFQMSQRSAYNFMGVHKEFGGKVATVASLPPTALYALAAPSTPEPVRTEVLERAANGEKVTAKEIESLKKKLEKAEAAAKAAAQSASVMEGRAQTIERELEGANLARLYAEQDKERLTDQIVDLEEEITRLKEPGVITLFNEAHVAPTSEPTPWTDDDAQFLTLRSVWCNSSPEAQSRFMVWLDGKEVSA